MQYPPDRCMYLYQKIYTSKFQPVSPNNVTYYTFLIFLGQIKIGSIKNLENLAQLIHVQPDVRLYTIGVFKNFFGHPWSPNWALEGTVSHSN